MSSTQVCICEKPSVEINQHHNLDNPSYPPPTAEDVSFLFSPNSTVIHHNSDTSTSTPVNSYADEGYENFKHHLSRTRQTFKIRGLHRRTTQVQTLEQILDLVQMRIKQNTEAKQLMLISGHLVSGEGDSSRQRDLVVKKIEERNRTFLERIIPAIQRQFGELRLSAPRKFGDKG